MSNILASKIWFVHTNHIQTSYQYNSGIQLCSFTSLICCSDWCHLH